MRHSIYTRLMPLFLLCVLLSAMAGCQGERPEEPPTPVLNYAAEYKDNWCYQTLSREQKQNYQVVYAALREGFSTDSTVTVSNQDNPVDGLSVTLPCPLKSADEVEQLYTALLRDHPLFFYVGSTYSYEGHHTAGADYYKTLCLTYIMNAAEREAATKRLEQEVQALIAQTGALRSDYEKELWLHDLLLEQCRYNRTAADSKQPLADYPLDFTAYGALVNGEAVCEGYASALHLLLQRAGIQSTLVSGYDQNGRAHMWNMAVINGNAYHLDPTWDDQDTYLSHLYFNLTTEDLLLTHTLDDDNFGLLPCTATEDNYFVRSGRYLDSYDRSAIAALVAEAAVAGEDCVELRFAADKYANACLFVSNESWFRSKVNKKMPAGVAPMWAYRYIFSPSYHVIALLKQS